MDSIERLSVIVDAMMKKRYSELASAVHSARMRLNEGRCVGDECASACVSILFHVEKYLRSLATQESAQTTTVESLASDNDRAFFSVWYSLGAFGLNEEDLAAIGVK